jgi:hypothetical protein
MSSSLNSRMFRLVRLVAPGAPLADGQAAASSENRPASARRRELLLGLAGAPFAAWATTDPTAGLQRWGSGEFRRFGFLVYAASLWAGDDPLRPPLALQLTYKRNITGAAIADASVKEIRQLGLADEATLARWGTLMAGLFPDVRPGDAIIGEYRAGSAIFHFNGRLLGRVEETAFARAFFAIWLDARTSAPDLRAALLQRGDGRG